MEYAIVALFFAAVWHFVYENILLPTTHVTLRNKLFELRDELREIQLADVERKFAHEIDIAQNGINNAIDSVEALDLSLQGRVARRYSTDKLFRDRVKARNEAIRNSSSVELKDIVKRCNSIIRDVFFYNSGGWLVYVIPIACAAIFYNQISATAKELFSLNEHDASRFFGKSVAC